MGFLHADNPTYEDMALFYGEAEYPELWPDFAWSPGFGQPYSSILQELISGKLPGVLTNMDRLTDWVTSEGRWALNYAGTLGVHVGIPGYTTTASSSPVSLFTWIKLDQLRDFQGIATTSKGVPDSFANWIFYTKADGSFGTYFAAHRTYAAGLTTGVWYHVGFSYNGSTLVLYLNGRAVLTSTSVSYTKSAGTLYLGEFAETNGSDVPHDGLIDDTLAYNSAVPDSVPRDLYSLNRGGWAKRKEVNRTLFKGVDIPATTPGIVAVINVSDRQPTYDDMAKDSGEAEYPELWPDFAWSPGFGQPYASVLQELINGKNHGTLTNMDPATDWVTSEGRWCLDFDGTDDHVPTGLVLSTTSPMTLVCWVRFAALSPSKYFFSDFNSGATASSFSLSNTSTTLRIVWAGLEILASSVTLAVDTWYHVVASRGGGTGAWNVLLSANGVITTGTTAANPTAGGILTLGRAGDFAGLYTACRIDDARVYNRAFSVNDTLLDYSLGRGGWAAARRRTVVSAGAASSSMLKRILTEGLFVGA